MPSTSDIMALLTSYIQQQKEEEERKEKLQNEERAKQDAFRKQQDAFRKQQDAFRKQQTQRAWRQDNQADLLQQAFDPVDAQLISTDNCKGSSLSPLGVETYFMALHCFTQLYGPFAAQLYSQPVGNVTQHTLLPIRSLGATTVHNSSLLMLAFHAQADMVVGASVNVSLDKLTQLCRDSDASIPIEQLASALRSAADTAAAAKRYTSSRNAIDVHIRVQMNGIPTSPANSMRISLGAAHARLTAWPPLPAFNLTSSSSSSSGPHVLTPENVTESDFTEAERHAIASVSTNETHNPSCRAQLQTAYLAHGATPPGFSGSGVWGTNQTVAPFTTTMVAVVSGYDPKAQQAYMSPISPLHKALAAAAQAVEALAVSSGWRCPPPQRRVALRIMRAVDLEQDVETLLRNLHANINDAALCAK